MYSQSKDDGHGLLSGPHSHGSNQLFTFCMNAGEWNAAQPRSAIPGSRRVWLHLDTARGVARNLRALQPLGHVSRTPRAQGCRAFNHWLLPWLRQGAALNNKSMCSLLTQALKHFRSGCVGAVERSCNVQQACRTRAGDLACPGSVAAGGPKGSPACMCAAQPSTVAFWMWIFIPACYLDPGACMLSALSAGLQLSFISVVGPYVVSGTSIYTCPTSILHTAGTCTHLMQAIPGAY